MTQAVHIGLYGFFYRTSERAVKGGSAENGEENVRLAASLFLLAYALLCSLVAAWVIGGTVGAAVVGGSGGHGHGGGEAAGGDPTSASRAGDRSDNVLRVVEAGGPFTAALASDINGSAHGHGQQHPSRYCSPGDGGGSFSWPFLGGAARGGGGRGGAEAKTGGARATEIPKNTDDARDLLYGDEDGEKKDEANAFHKARLTGWSLQLGQEEDEDDGFSSGGTGAAFGGAGGGYAAAAIAESQLAEAVAAAARARGQSLRRGCKAYLRLTVGMMVGWAYNLWGQVEFRQEELESRFGPALGATVYAALSTALGVCIMVRGADRLDTTGAVGAAGTADVDGAIIDGEVGHGGEDISGELLGGGDGVNGRQDLSGDGGGGSSSRNERRDYFWFLKARRRGGEGEGDQQRREADDKRWKKAVMAVHAQRMLVVVGGLSLMVGWAWEESFDLTLEAFVGDSAAVGMILAKLGLAIVATAVVLWWEIAKSDASASGQHDVNNRGGDGHSGAAEDGLEERRMLSAPLMPSAA